MSPMTNKSNTDSTYPELVSSSCSQSDIALSSIGTESLALSQESETVDIWSQLPVRKYTNERKAVKTNGYVTIADLHLLIGI